MLSQSKNVTTKRFVSTLLFLWRFRHPHQTTQKRWCPIQLPLSASVFARYPLLYEISNWWRKRYVYKMRPNDRNILTQPILYAPGHLVATCCNILGDVLLAQIWSHNFSNLKLRPNDRKISAEQIAPLLGEIFWVLLAQIWQMVKFEPTAPNISRCSRVIKCALQIASNNVAICCDRLAQLAGPWDPVKLRNFSDSRP